MPVSNRNGKSVSVVAACAGALVLLFAHGKAVAQSQGIDHCITCVGPDRTYLCRLTSANSPVNGGQMMCIMNIAQQYGHGSCKASNRTGGCEGVLVIYDTANLGPMPGGQRERPRMRAVEEYEKQQKDNPDTLVGLTKQTFKKTEQGWQKLSKNTDSALKNLGSNTKNALQKTGEVITDTTTTTFNCVFSLFTNCGAKKKEKAPVE